VCHVPRQPTDVDSAEPPGLVLLHLWGVRPRHVPSALARMATNRRRLHRTPGLRFHKLLGTGDGRTFTTRDADPLHWGLLTCWDDVRDGERFAHGAADQADHPVLDSWRRIAREELVVQLRPLASRGSWAGRQPFGDPRPRRTQGQVASITRARISPRKTLTFWRAVPPVSHDLHQVDGLRLAVGIGEAPVGLQGTFSLWRDSAALNDFAHGRRPHREAIRRTSLEHWYAEELFARFEVLRVDGTFAGDHP
jgi:hypothetical protein